MTLSTSISFLMHQFDSKIADKPTREKFYNDMMEFSYRQPFIASFMFLQLTFALLPLLGFLGFAVGVVAVTLGICGFWIGVGLCVLLSTLAFTATIATVVWSCACASFSCARWVAGVLALVGSSERAAAVGAKKGKGREKKDGRVVGDLHAVEEREKPEKRPKREEVGEGDDEVDVAETASESEFGSGSGSGSQSGSGSGSEPGSDGTIVDQALALGEVHTVRTTLVSEVEKMKRDIEQSLR